MMPAAVVKRVRLDKAQARFLPRFAKEEGLSEPEALREALRRVERSQAREKNMHKLIALANVGKPDDDKFELR